MSEKTGVTIIRLRAALVSFLMLASAVFAAASDDRFRDQPRDTTTRRGMAVLGTWAAANILVSTPLLFAGDPDHARFHEMNAAWNVVNLGIAGLGLIGNSTTPPSQSFGDAVDAQRRLESTLLLNIGLDAAYAAAGWALLERSRRPVPDAERWSGYGSSLILQGGFLFVFDVVFLLFQQRNRPDLSAVK